MLRLRLRDFRLSRAAQAVGICQGDLASVASIVNAAQERLVLAREAGDTGWWGSWMRMAFNVAQGDPYITLPREVARLINTDVCNQAIAIQNEFYEFLEFGVGLQPQPNCCASLDGSNCQFLQMYDRGLVPTFADIASSNKTIRAYLTDASDLGKRVLIQGLDSNAADIRSQDGLVPVLGEYLTLQSPFAQAPLAITKVTGIQKDTTNGPVKFYEVDLTTGDTRLLLTMEPSEQVAGYRRMFINGLPRNCCGDATTSTTQVTGMAKLELIPVQQDTDYLLIQSLQALVLECQSVRFSEMDSPAADKKSAQKHHEALGILQGQLTHYLGKTKPAVVFKPFGSASLRRQGIGILT